MSSIPPRTGTHHYFVAKQKVAIHGQGLRRSGHRSEQDRCVERGLIKF